MNFVGDGDSQTCFKSKREILDDNDVNQTLVMTHGAVSSAAVGMEEEAATAGTTTTFP
jgi:hypothetical protein